MNSNFEFPSGQLYGPGTLAEIKSRNKNKAVIPMSLMRGLKNKFLIADEFIGSEPIHIRSIYDPLLSAFNPYESSQRLFIIRKPAFIEQIERSAEGYHGSIWSEYMKSTRWPRYALPRADLRIVPKLHYDRKTKTWHSTYTTPVKETKPRSIIFEDFAAVYRAGLGPYEQNYGEIVGKCQGGDLHV